MQISRRRSNKRKFGTLPQPPTFPPTFQNILLIVLLIFIRSGYLKSDNLNDLKNEFDRVTYNSFVVLSLSSLYDLLRNVIGLNAYGFFLLILVLEYINEHYFNQVDQLD